MLGKGYFEKENMMIYETMIEAACDLAAGGDNDEYIRGMAELIALVVGDGYLDAGTLDLGTASEGVFMDILKAVKERRNV